MIDSFYIYSKANEIVKQTDTRNPMQIASDTGIMQRISGGTAHWLFRKMVLRDLWNSITRLFN